MCVCVCVCVCVDGQTLSRSRLEPDLGSHEVGVSAEPRQDGAEGSNNRGVEVTVMLEVFPA